MSREKLPARRFCETRDFLFRDNMSITVSFGRNNDGIIKEVFINGGGREGAEMSLILADAATILSIALQRGSTPAELLKSIRREPTGNKPSSAIGFIITQMAKANKDGAEKTAEITIPHQEAVATECSV